MERKIGEIFEYNSEWYQCLKGISCEECDFSSNGITCDIHGAITCTRKGRSDDTSVVFKKLEKVGEPYNFQKRTFQTYKLHTIPFLSECVELVAIPSMDNNTIEIEIKPNKEDMEEKKLNLKTFSLEAAKSGKPVCTRDGRKARIICFDRDWDMHIVALVADPIGETVYYYLSNGKVDFDKQNDADLMMLPEKKEGWVNVHRLKSPGDNDFPYVSTLYPTKEEAITNANLDVIDTIKISWEE